MRVQFHAILSFVAVALVLAAVAAAAVDASSAAVPPNTMFKSGYNKCKVASLAAVDKTTGKKFAKAKFDGKTCTWSSTDGGYVILLDTHPTAGYLEYFVPSVGRHAAEVVKRVTVPGASKALLDTHAYKNTHRYQKDLFAVYPQGIVQVSMDYSTALPDSVLIAVMRLLTHV
jgi:hypothetical protein